MHIGGGVYVKILALLDTISDSLLNDKNFDDQLHQLKSVSSRFQSNHQISFDFLDSDQLNQQNKTSELNKIITLVSRLQSEDESRLEAYDKMSKYR